MTTTTRTDATPDPAPEATRTGIPILHLGGPTVLFELAGLRILTDPTFDPPGLHPFGDIDLLKLSPPARSRDDVGAVDLVLLSHHQHPDNLDDAGRLAVDEAGIVLSTPAAAAAIPGVRGLQPWESTEIETSGGSTLAVTAVPALHGPPGFEELSGPVTGFVLQSDGHPTVYVSGDNASVALVEEIAGRFPAIDVAFLFAGAARSPYGPEALTLTADDAVRAAAALRHAVIVPVHTEGWLHFTEGPGTVARALMAAGFGDRLRMPLAGVDQMA